MKKKGISNAVSDDKFDYWAGAGLPRPTYEVTPDDHDGTEIGIGSLSFGCNAKFCERNFKCIVPAVHHWHQDQDICHHLVAYALQHPSHVDKEDRRPGFNICKIRQATLEDRLVKILNLLKVEQLNSYQLAEKLEVNPTTIKRMIKLLKDRGYEISSEKEFGAPHGKNYYQLNKEGR